MKFVFIIVTFGTIYLSCIVYQCVVLLDSSKHETGSHHHGNGGFSPGLTSTGPRRVLLEQQQKQRTNDDDSSFELQLISQQYKSIQQIHQQRIQDRKRQISIPKSLDSYVFVPRIHPLLLSSSQKYNHDAIRHTTTNKKKPNKAEESSHDNKTKWCGNLVGHAISNNNHDGSSNKEYIPLSSQTDRILITGIVSHNLGVSVAMALKATCGMTNVVGIDSFYPNTVKHRMQIMDERYKLLMKSNVTLLNHYSDDDDASLPYVGLQPRDNYYSNSHNGTESDSTIDFVVKSIIEYKPTHIVHLSNLLGAEDILFHGTMMSSKYDSVSQQDSSQAEVLESMKDQHISNTDGGTVLPSSFPSQKFRLQHGLTSMEQILKSIDMIERLEGYTPHLVFGSSHRLSEFLHQDDNGATTHGSTTLQHNYLFATQKRMEEQMVQSVSLRTNLTYVGLRLSTFYGPAGSFGTDLHDMAERATLGPSVPVLLPEGATLEGGGLGSIKAKTSVTKHEAQSWWQTVHNISNVNLVYVDDVAEAILAAMQLRSSSGSNNNNNNNDDGSSPNIFYVGGNETVSLTDVALLMEDILPRKSETSVTKYLKSVYGDEDVTQTRPISSQLSSQLSLTQQTLGWTPSTSLKDGISRTVLWHFHRRFSYGPSIKQVSKTISSDSFDKAQQWVTSPLEKIPCSSECSSDYCLADFDSNDQRQTVWSHDVLEASANATDGCAVALYSENYDKTILHDNSLRTSSKSKNDDIEALVCKVMFVRQTSDLVSMFASSSEYNYDQTDKASFLEHYNGRVLYKNWKIVWLEDKPRSLADLSYAKIAPLNLFADSIIHALYLDPNKRYPPGTDEAMSIAKSMLSKQIKSKKKWVGRAPKRFQITIPKRPSRRAALMASYPELTKDFSKQIRSILGGRNERLVMKYFSHLMNGYDIEDELLDVPKDGSSTTDEINTKQSQNEILRKRRQQQMAFYDFANRRLNDDLEFRDLTDYLDIMSSSSNDETTNNDSTKRERMERVPIYPIYTQWVIHDLQLEVARELRCDWYTEQLFWDTPLQDSSLSYVFMKRWANQEMGTPCGSWAPILQRRSDNHLPRYEYPYQVSPYNRGCKMYHDAIGDGRHFGSYVALTKKPMSDDMIDQVLRAAKLIAEKKRIKLLQEQQSSNDESEDPSNVDAMDLMASIREHAAFNKGPPVAPANTEEQPPLPANTEQNATP